MNRFSQANPMHSGQSNPSSNSSHIVILPTPTVTESTATPFTTNTHQNDLMDTLNRLKFFLATAPSHWVDAPVNDPDRTPRFNSFLLPNGESVSCVYWNGIFHITGTDIVRVLLFRFEAFGRPVRNFKKFEEGVFSDLRNLKPGIHATLEEAKSQFLDVLFKHRCIRTHKKQKVFYWFTVDHDHLFLDALERDLKREKVGQEPTTVVVGEPARSFKYDPRQPLYEQYKNAHGAVDGEEELEMILRQLNSSTDLNNSLGTQPAPPVHSISHPHPNSIPSPPPPHLGKRSANDDIPRAHHVPENASSSDHAFRQSSPASCAPLRDSGQAPKRRRGRSGVGNTATPRKSPVQPLPSSQGRPNTSGLHCSPERALSPCRGSSSDFVKSEVASDGYASSTFSDHGNGHAYRGDSVVELTSDGASTVRAGSTGGNYHHSVMSRVRISPQGFSNREHMLQHPQMQTAEQVHQLQHPPFIPLPYNSQDGSRVGGVAEGHTAGAAGSSMQRPAAEPIEARPKARIQPRPLSSEAPLLADDRVGNISEYSHSRRSSTPASITGSTTAAFPPAAGVPPASGSASTVYNPTNTQPISHSREPSPVYRFASSDSLSTTNLSHTGSPQYPNTPQSSGGLYPSLYLHQTPSVGSRTGVPAVEHAGLLSSPSFRKMRPTKELPFRRIHHTASAEGLHRTSSSPLGDRVGGFMLPNSGGPRSASVPYQPHSHNLLDVTALPPRPSTSQSYHGVELHQNGALLGEALQPSFDQSGTRPILPPAQDMSANTVSIFPAACNNDENPSSCPTNPEASIIIPVNNNTIPPAHTTNTTPPNYPAYHNYSYSPVSQTSINQRLTETWSSNPNYSDWDTGYTTYDSSNPYLHDIPAGNGMPSGVVAHYPVL